VPTLCTPHIFWEWDNLFRSTDFNRNSCFSAITSCSHNYYIISNCTLCCAFSSDMMYCFVSVVLYLRVRPGTIFKVLFLDLVPVPWILGLFDWCFGFSVSLVCWCFGFSACLTGASDSQSVWFGWCFGFFSQVYPLLQLALYSSTICIC